MAQQAAETRIDLQRLRKVCSSCSLAELCLPMGLSRSDVERLDRIVQPTGPLHTGEHIYRVDDPFEAIYAVRSGYIKTYLVDESGREQVLGFHLPGELVGLDAIYPNRHQCNAIALDTVTVCKLPYGDIASLATQVASLQNQIFRLMSKDIGGSHALSGDFTAEERVASFLMSISSRLHLRGYSATDFILAMTRRDIANYLRLATETVSRVFAKFQDDGLIAVDRRNIRVLELDKLAALCRSVPQV
ncbi:MAG: helix-turn-helix domain-containing protein [Gammaproteobacteria bacterium]|nr:helix-turn-helix domain-containing protein [Gammaproteobacteria bacterium]